MLDLCGNPTFGKILGLVFGNKTIKTCSELFWQAKGLPEMGYGTDYLKAYEHLILGALHLQWKRFTTQV